MPVGVILRIFNGPVFVFAFAESNAAKALEDRARQRNVKIAHRVENFRIIFSFSKDSNATNYPGPNSQNLH
jgi:hypothetical protein